jgi:hypothetical protein
VPPRAPDDSLFDQPTDPGVLAKTEISLRIKCTVNSPSLVGIQLCVVRTDISAPAVGGHDVKKEHVTYAHAYRKKIHHATQHSAHT